MNALLLPLPLLVCALALPAHAQSLHKCTVDGKVSYSQTPCEKGRQTVLEVPQTPPPDAAAAADLKRQERAAHKLEAERHKREARAEREDASADRAAAAHRKRCGKLALSSKWAREDAAGATPQQQDKAAQRARRAAELHALECGN